MSLIDRDESQRPSGPSARRVIVHGFTVTELLVVIFILAVVMGLAVPSFARMANAAAISSGVNQFMADVRFARSEAIRRGGGIVLCRSENPEASDSTCAAGAGSLGWASGWIVFHDIDGNGDRGALETLLRAQGRNAGIESIATDGTPTLLRFTAIGRLTAPGAVSALRFGAPTLSADIRRVVCVGPGGRARIAGDGTATCISGE